jgi:hypothetical protein
MRIQISSLVVTVGLLVSNGALAETRGVTTLGGSNAGRSSQMTTTRTAYSNTYKDGGSVYTGAPGPSKETKYPGAIRRAFHNGNQRFNAYMAARFTKQDVVQSNRLAQIGGVPMKMDVQQKFAVVNGKRTEVSRNVVSYLNPKGAYILAPRSRYGSVLADTKQQTIRINYDSSRGSVLQHDAPRHIVAVDGAKKLPHINAAKGTISYDLNGKKQTDSFVFPDKPVF